VDNTKPSVIACHGLAMVILSRRPLCCCASRIRTRRRERVFMGSTGTRPIQIFALWRDGFPSNRPKWKKFLQLLAQRSSCLRRVAVFLLNNEVLQLEPVLEDPTGKTLFFILRDETSKTTTYSGGRFLHYRTAGPWTRPARQPGARLQRAGKSALCLHRLFHVSAAARTESVGNSIAGGRKRYQR